MAAAPFNENCLCDEISGLRETRLGQGHLSHQDIPRLLHGVHPQGECITAQHVLWRGGIAYRVRGSKWAFNHTLRTFIDESVDTDAVVRAGGSAGWAVNGTVHAAAGIAQRRKFELC